MYAHYAPEGEVRIHSGNPGPLKISTDDAVGLVEHDATLAISGSGGIQTTMTDGCTVSIGLTNTSVTPGTYKSADITVNSQGRVTAASVGRRGTISVEQVNCLTGPSRGISIGKNGSGDVKIDASCVGNITGTVVAGPIIDARPTIANVAAGEDNRMCCGKYIVVKNSGKSGTIRPGHILSVSNEDGDVELVTQGDADTPAHTGVFGVAMEEAETGQALKVCISGYVTVLAESSGITDGDSTGGNVIVSSTRGLGEIASGGEDTGSVGLMLKHEYRDSGGNILVWLGHGKSF
jgi:hypothetical protein